MNQETGDRAEALLPAALARDFTCGKLAPDLGEDLWIEYKGRRAAKEGSPPLRAYVQIKGTRVGGGPYLCRSVEVKHLRRWAAQLLPVFLVGVAVEASPPTFYVKSIHDLLGQDLDGRDVALMEEETVQVRLPIASDLLEYLRAEIEQHHRRTAPILLDKAEKMSRVFSAFNDRLPALRAMERVFHDPWLSADEKRHGSAEHWKEFEEFLAQAEGDSASQATTRALTGWARRLAGHEDEGINMMREAARLDGDLPYGELMETLVWLSNYLRRQPPRVFMIAGGTERPSTVPPEDSESVQIRERIHGLLDQAAMAPVWGKGPARDLRAAMEGVRAIAREDLEPAVQGLSVGLQATNLQPFWTEFLVARAKILCKLGKGTQALPDLCKVKESWPDVAGLLCDCAMLRFWAIARGPEEAKLGFQECLALLDEAVVVDPDCADAYRNRGFICWFRGAARANRGVESRDDFKHAIADLSRAIVLSPEEPNVLCSRADALLGLAIADANGGVDPIENYERALSDYNAGLENCFDEAQVYDGRGRAYLGLGAARAARGEDSRSLCESGIAEFTAYIERKPEDAEGYCQRGRAYEALSQSKCDRRHDGREALLKAILDYEQAIKLKPESAEAYEGRAIVYMRLGDGEAERGGDPRNLYLRGIADADEVLRRKPQDADWCFNRAQLYLALALAQRERGVDPRQSAEGALADYHEILRLDPARKEAQIGRGLAFQLLGDLEKAIEAFEKVLDAQPGDQTAESMLDDIWAEVTKQKGPEWAREMVIASEAVGCGEYVVAREKYERALQTSGDTIPQEPRLRSLLGGAHYNLACIHALLSVGKASPKTDPQPVAPDDARRHGECAIQHLTRAIDLGFADKGHLTEDTDLILLHEDPRWRALLNRLSE